MYSMFFIFHVVLERSCCCSHGLKIRLYIEYQMKECKNFKNFKFSRKFTPTLIPFIVLNKNQHAHGQEMAIMMYDMQEKKEMRQRR